MGCHRACLSLSPSQGLHMHRCSPELETCASSLSPTDHPKYFYERGVLLPGPCCRLLGPRHQRPAQPSAVHLQPGTPPGANLQFSCQ